MDINIKKATTLIDELVEIQLTGLKAQQSIKIVASIQDHQGQVWQSANLFKADEQGWINTAKQAPIKGSYQGIDPWGILWSMKPTLKTLPYSLFALQSCQPLNLELSFYDGNNLVATRSLERKILAASIERQEIENESVTGILFLPTGSSEKQKGIVLVPGSVGLQMTEPMAALLAAKGFAVLLLAYCRYKQLPTEIYDLPLERIKEGVAWFKQHPAIDSEQVTGLGISKGAEGLLAAASYFPHIGLKSLVAMVPSHVILQGVGKGRPVKRSSWSLFNEPMNFLPYREDQLFFPMLKSKLIKKMRINKIFPKWVGIKLLKSYQLALTNKRLALEVEIPVEKIQSPLVLISAGDDQVWPSKVMCERIIQKMPSDNMPEHWHYEGAGHLFRIPGIPTTVNQAHITVLDLVMGGKDRAVAYANEDYWYKLGKLLNADLL